MVLADFWVALAAQREAFDPTAAPPSSAAEDNIAVTGAWEPSTCPASVFGKIAGEQGPSTTKGDPAA